MYCIHLRTEIAGLSGGDADLKDRKGEFLDSIGKIGRAPGEYLGLSEFYSDPETDELYILSVISCSISEERVRRVIICRKYSRTLLRVMNGIE